MGVGEDIAEVGCSEDVNGGGGGVLRKLCMVGSEVRM